MKTSAENCVKKTDSGILLSANEQILLRLQFLESKALP